MYSTTNVKWVKLPSGAWIRTDRVDAVTVDPGDSGDVLVELSSGKTIKAAYGLATTNDIVELITGETIVNTRRP